MRKSDIIKTVENTPKARMIKHFSRYKIFTMYRILGGRMSELPRNACKEDIYNSLVKLVSTKKECISNDRRKEEGRQKS